MSSKRSKSLGESAVDEDEWRGEIEIGFGQAISIKIKIICENHFEIINDRQ